MNKISIAGWVCIGIAVVLLITGIVLYFVAPKFTFLMSGLIIGSLTGFIGGYFVAKSDYSK